MIEINLLPGAGKKSRGRGAAAGLAGAVSSAFAQVKDPFLLGAVGAVLLAMAGIAGMFVLQRAEAASLDERLQLAQQDSIRYSAVIREKRKAEAQRDSVVKQVDLIRAFDNKRFVWPHIMDELSRALPQYTWLTSLTQTSATAVVADSAATTDSTAVVPRIQFRIVGNTVDMQALTRFMRVLEASAFIEQVQLVKSSLVIVEGKEVTEFQLDASYENPDPSAIRTTPFSLSVR
ncbi:MAG TPA: PilN domain-containing protein [Gemmatimonadaceae bacterium]|nr:PilN domain-containing protein [Gemmatimonadaceae bacterium]